MARLLAQWYECQSCGSRYPDRQLDGCLTFHKCPLQLQQDGTYAYPDNPRDEGPDHTAHERDDKGNIVRIVYRPIREGKGRVPVAEPVKPQGGAHAGRQ